MENQTLPTTTTTQKPLYLDPTPVTLAAIDLVICLVCIVTNGSIIWLTAATKKLRTHRGCILIALLAAVHIGAKSGSIIPSLVAWTVSNVPQFPHCVVLNTIGVLSGSTAPCMILVIAVDRLLGATFPMWYKSSKNSLYLGGLSFFASSPPSTN